MYINQKKKPIVIKLNTKRKALNFNNSKNTVFKNIKWKKRQWNYLIYRNYEKTSDLKANIKFNVLTTLSILLYVVLVLI